MGGQVAKQPDDTMVEIVKDQNKGNQDAHPKPETSGKAKGKTQQVKSKPPDQDRLIDLVKKALAGEKANRIECKERGFKMTDDATPEMERLLEEVGQANFSNLGMKAQAYIVEQLGGRTPTW